MFKSDIQVQARISITFNMLVYRAVNAMGVQRHVFFTLEPDGGALSAPENCSRAICKL